MKARRSSIKFSELRTIISLVLLVLVFFIPLLVNWEKFFFDDIACVFYPQQVFLSRCLAKGLIPWWNPYICAGATPFYAHIFQSSLFPLNWPFLLIAHLFPAFNYLWLIKLPLLFYYLLSVIFSYLFSRRGLRLTGPGSFVFTLAYTFNPAMIYFSTCPPEVAIQAWLPFFCLCLISFSRNGRMGWLILGAIAFAIVSPAGDVPIVSHLIFITALFGAGLLITALIDNDWHRAGRVMIGGFVIFGVGFLLSGVYWSNMIEGLKMLGSGSQGIVEELSGLEQSLHPAYLATLFIPDFFGGITSHHAWGAAYYIHLSLNDANLLGGLLSFFLIFLGLLVVIKRNRENDEKVAVYNRFWWIFFGIFFFSLIIVLGAYTPLYRIFRVIIPVLKMPYPVRFRSIECFAMAGLMGVSVSLLKDRFSRNRIRKAVVYLILALLLPVAALLWTYRTGGAVFSPGWRHLSVLGDWGWFLRGPFFYLVSAGIFIILITVFKRGRYLYPLLVIGVSVELLIFAYPAFYHNRILNHRYYDSFAIRYEEPSDHPVYQEILSWNPEDDSEVGKFRRLHYRSYYDNLALLNRGLNMFGFDIKPLDHRFQEIIEELTRGFPYDVLVRRWDSSFWPNMSVRYVLSRDPVFLPHFQSRKKIGSYYTYELNNSLPRFYFQDCWFSAGESTQRKALLEYNLKEAGYCGSEIWKGLSGIKQGKIEEGVGHFIELHHRNRIIESDLTNPNRLVLEVEVLESSMLVVTDVWNPGWQATVNGNPAKIHRVNYLQRGIWCLPGKYRVVMEFSPSTLPRGILLTGLGIFGLVILVVVSRKHWRRLDLKINK